MEPLSADELLVPPAIDTLPISFAVLDAEGTILWTNRACHEFGAENDILTDPDSIGHNYLDAIETEDDAAETEVDAIETENGDSAREAALGLEAVLAGDREAFELEYPCHSPDERRWFLLRAAPFTVAGQRYAAVAHIDVTERVLSEQERERFERAIEAAGQIVFITDRDGTITYVNPAFETVTGYDAAEAIGRTPRLLKSGEHDPRFYEGLWETILAGETWTGTIVNRRKSGQLFHAYATIDPIRDESGEVSQFVAVQAEITDFEEMKRQLQTIDDLLRHDLRTELTVIVGHAEGIGMENADAMEASEAIVDAAERLLTTTEKTRQLRRFLERTMDPEPVDVARIAREVASAQRDRFPDAEIVVDAPETAVGLGAEEIEVALTELVENAVVHSDRSIPRVRLEVTDGDDVTVSVEDDGPGIHPLEYESYETELVTPIEHGRGVGLDIVYWIVRRSGGRFQVTEREPRGSTVTIELLKPEVELLKPKRS